ncbi:transposase [Clostridium thermarum]|uniref:transposase n=1 Tax=Clostridium thermarum TaxID=1716543 RepID=UPI0015D672CD|nr:transposase [Clostridium thermarum]
MAREIRRYSKEEIAGHVARLFPPENKSLGELSIETGISKSTLATWKKKAEKEKGHTKPRRNLTPNERFLVVMEAYSLSEIELSRYCREKGLYYEEVKSWISACATATDKTEEREDIKELRVSKAADAKVSVKLSTHFMNINLVR